MKKILLAVIILFSNVCANAQTDPVRTQLNYIFQYIDKAQIPTGYLNEYGPEVVNKKWLNGILGDSNLVADITTYNFLYNDIENSKILATSTTPPVEAKMSRTTLIPLDTAKVMINLARYDSLTTLTFFSADFASLNENALNLNLFTKVGNQIYDVANRTQSPYILNHTFASAPVLPESKYNNEIRLGYKELFYGNTNNVISSVQINFLDGAGYQNLFSNNTATPLTKYYNDSSGYKKFIVKLIYTNGLTDECYTGQMVNVIQPVNNTANRYQTLNNVELNNPTHKIAPTNYLNINPTIPAFWANNPNSGYTQNLLSIQKFKQDMKIYIRYKERSANDPLRNKIVKPFIIVEGYDLTDASPLLKTNNYNLNTLLGEWERIITTPTTFDFNKELDETAGYDLIFIDYYTMRNITENADYLLQAIDWINSQKVNNAVGVREQNVVMGISMGGLVSRYALAKRTKVINNTETKMLFTMDSPHQGANVPLGLQHFLYDFGEVRIVKKIGDVSDELKAFYYSNTLPATQEQLILRVTNGGGGRANNTFLADGGPYRSMVDYNAPYLFYAVSNGSQCGQTLMQPSTLILRKEGNVASVNWALLFVSNKYRLNIQVNALPNFGSQAQICSVVMERNIRLFFGLVGTGWTTTSNTTPRFSPPNTIPWDILPGGTKSTETSGPISNISTFPNGRDRTFLGNIWRALLIAPIVNGSTNIQIPFSQKEFNFVPITSALDVQNVTANTFNQNFNFSQNGLTGSRANKFITQDFAAESKFNIEHTNFTARNARWIYNEMQNLTQPLDCNDYCSGQFEGPNSFCTSATYSLPATAGTTVTWSLTNIVPAFSATYQVNPNGTVTVTRLADGTATLNAQASGGCFNTATNISKNLRYGGSSSGYYTINSSPTQFPITTNIARTVEVRRNTTVFFNLNFSNSPGVSNFRWQCSDGTTGTGGVFSISVTSSAYQYSITTKNVYITADSPCGPISYSCSFSVISSLAGRSSITDSTFIATPNPVNDILNVRVTSTSQSKTTKASGFYNITIAELNSNMPLRRIVLNKTGRDFQINMAGLKTGYYAVEINDGNEKQILKIYKL
jgi:hypothetical protein